MPDPADEPVQASGSDAGGRGPARPEDVDLTTTMALRSDIETEEAVGEVTPGGDALPPGSALLVVKRGPNAGSRFLLHSDTVTVGRHPASDIFLDDITVSRRHAEFFRQQGEFHVRDVGSLNGTYVNRARIDSSPLTGGDEVQIGKFRLAFLAGGAQ